MIIDLVPLDAPGIQLNRPSHEAKWRKLTNVSVKDGSLVPRVGFKEVGQLSNDNFPSVAISSVLAITEVLNPGSSLTGRESWTPLVETLTPTGSSDIVVGWGGDHLDIDEAAPPDGNFMSSSTIGAQKGLTWSNLVGSPTSIVGILIKGLAKAVKPGGEVVLKFYNRVSNANTSFGTVTISESEAAAEVDQYQFFSLFNTLNPTTLKQWTPTEIDALEIVVEFESGSSTMAELVVPDGDGSFTAWTDFKNGGAATVGDFNTGTMAWNSGKTSSQENGAKTDTANDRQSFTLPSSLQSTFSTVTTVNWFFWFSDFSNVEHQVELFFRVGGTNHVVGTASFGTYGSGSMHQVTISSTTNPADSAAWEQSDLAGGEFGLRNVNGTTLIMRSASCFVEGTNTSQTVRLEWLSVEVAAATSNLIGDAILVGERLFSSNQTHIRMNDDRPGTAQFVDISNGVPLSNTLPVDPMDYAYLYGQVYVTNGVDPTVFYPNDANTFSEMSANNATNAAAITGRTIESFADRILYGWVKDGTDVTPERVAYSKQFNGQEHNDDSAGDFDIIDSAGGIVSLKTLNESLCFAGKEVGIYALRRTGNARAPIIVDPIDYETRCLAKMSVQRVLNSEGTPVIMFLGWNPSVGLNVFQFDGTRIIPVGDSIAPAIRDDASKGGEFLRFSCAGVEPISGAYWLAFAEGNDGVPDSGYGMDLRSGAWTRFELPFSFISMGSWHIPNYATTPSNVPALYGLPRLILGGMENKPYLSDDTITWDALSSPSESMTSNQDFFTVDPSNGLVGRNRKIFTCEMETGDFRAVQQTGDATLIPYRLHIVYTNLGPITLSVRASEDGGITFPTDNAITFNLGSPDVDKKKIHATLDLGSLNAARTRINIRVAPSTDRMTGEHYWQFDEMYLDVGVGGTDGPEEGDGDRGDSNPIQASRLRPVHGAGTPTPAAQSLMEV